MKHLTDEELMQQIHEVRKWVDKYQEMIEKHKGEVDIKDVRKEMGQLHDLKVEAERRDSLLNKTAPIPVILNPRAGNGSGLRTFEEIKNFFAQKQMDLFPVPTSAPREAVSLVQSLINEGIATLFSMGGDGTSFEVINGIMKSGQGKKIRLGILPVGTGNSFMRDFGISDWHGSAERILNGQTRFIDVGKAAFIQEGIPQELFFHNVFGLGMMARGCELRHHKFRFLGKWAYHAAFFYMLPFRPVYTYHLILDGQRKIIKTPVLAICNSQYTGTNMHLCPSSCAHDGLLELFYTDAVPAWQILRIFQLSSTGEHIRHPAVHILQAKEIVIESGNQQTVMIDGDLEGCLPVQVEIEPGAMQLFV